MSPEKQALIDYLMTKTGGAIMMTPKQLAVEFGVSEKQQSKLRQEGRFPVPHKDFGRSVKYAINAVADFMLGTEVKHDVPAPSQPRAQNSAPLRTVKKVHTEPQDLSQLILLKGFVTHLEQQMGALETLHRYFSKYVQSKSMSEDLEQTLSHKEELTPRIRHVIP